MAVGGVAARLDVHLGDERARRVDRRQAPLGGVAVHRRRDAVRGQDERRTPRSVTLVLDEYRPALLELAYHVCVVNDLFADVHRRPVQGQCSLDRLDRALDARAVPSRRGQKDSLNHLSAKVAPVSSAAARPHAGSSVANPSKK